MRADKQTKTSNYILDIYKFLNPPKNPLIGPGKCPVDLRLPWKGKVSQQFENHIKQTVSHSYYADQPWVTFTTRWLLPSVQKYVLPSSHTSKIISEFQCQCDARYVGRTSLRLKDCLEQHVPLGDQTGPVNRTDNQLGLVRMYIVWPLFHVPLQLVSIYWIILIVQSNIVLAGLKSWVEDTV